MPKGTRKKPYVQTGQANFGSMGTSRESDVINSKGKAVSGNPEGGAARSMIGDKGVKAHKKAVAKDYKAVKKGKEGYWKKTVTTSSKSKQVGPKKPATKKAPAKKTPAKKAKK